MSNTLHDPLKIQSIEFLPTKFYKKQHLIPQVLRKKHDAIDPPLTKQVQNSKRVGLEKEYEKRLTRSRYLYEFRFNLIISGAYTLSTDLLYHSVSRWIV